MTKLTLDEKNFDEEIQKPGRLMLIDFWAEWCGPCKILSPLIDELATAYEGKVTIGKVDVDANNGLVGRYNIMSIPTMKFFKDGKQVGEIIGAAPKASIEAELKKHL